MHPAQRSATTSDSTKRSLLHRLFITRGKRPRITPIPSAPTQPTRQHAPLLTIARQTTDLSPQRIRDRKTNWLVIALAILTLAATAACLTLAIRTEDEGQEFWWMLGFFVSMGATAGCINFGIGPRPARFFTRKARTIRGPATVAAVLFAVLLTLAAAVIALGAAIDPDDPEFVDYVEFAGLLFAGALMLTLFAETLVAPPLTVRPKQKSGHWVLYWTVWFFGAFAVSATAASVSVLVQAREDQTMSVVLQLIVSLLIPLSWIPVRWAGRRPARYRDARPEIASQLMRLSSAAQLARADAQASEVTHLADEVSTLRATLRRFRDESPLATRSGTDIKLLDLLGVVEFRLRGRTPQISFTQNYPQELAPIFTETSAELAHAVEDLSNDLLKQVQ